MKRAFTILEVMVVVAIMATLLGLLIPVFRSAKQSAKSAQSISNLRNLYLSIEMYRSDQLSATEYGEAANMGLPPALSKELRRMLDQHVPPEAPHAHPGSWPLGKQYVVMWPVLIDWGTYTQQAQSSAVLIVDPFFNTGEVALTVPTRFTRKFLSCRVDGSTKWKFGKGEWMNSIFWSQ